MENITRKNREVVESGETWNWIKNYWHLPAHKKITIFDQKFRLLTLLKRDDVMGMKNSVEFRIPYLDINFLNWSNALDEKIRLNKKILKKIINPKIKNLISKKKLGSVSSIDEWMLSTAFFKKLLNIAKEKNSFSRNYLDFNEVIKLLNNRKLNLKYSYILQNLYFIEIWFKKNNI